MSSHIPIFIPIILAAILSVVYLASYRISNKIEKWHEYILSIGSGMLLAIVFVEVIPELIREGTKFLSAEVIALSILAGFVGYHLIEKYTYKHTSGTLQTTEIGYLHAFGFFIDNFLEGFIIVLISLTALQTYTIYILFIPLLLGDIAASTTFRHINDRFKLKKASLIFLSSSILIGSISAILLNLRKSNFYLALAVMSGIFIYFITRDEIPRGRKGKPLAFLFAVLFVLALFLIIR